MEQILMKRTSNYRGSIVRYLTYFHRND